MCMEGIERLRFSPGPLGDAAQKKKKTPGLCRHLHGELSWQSWFGSISVQDMGNCYTGQAQEVTAAPGVG